MSKESEAIVLMFNEYKVELLGAEKPRVRIVLSKKTSPSLERCAVELPQGSPDVKISVSTDNLMSDDKSKVGVAVSIQSQATPTLLSLANRTGEAVSACTITSFHKANSASRFLEACKNIVESGDTVPVTILNSKGRVLCVLQATKAERFSWSEKMNEMEELREAAQTPREKLN
jgi:hypothetical protein